MELKDTRDFFECVAVLDEQVDGELPNEVEPPKDDEPKEVEPPKDDTTALLLDTVNALKEELKNLKEQINTRKED